MATPTLSAKAQWALGVTQEQVDAGSQQASQHNSRPSSRLRSSRTSLSNEQRPTFQSATNSASVSRAPSRTSNPQQTKSRFARARSALSRNQSPSRPGSRNLYQDYTSRERGTNPRSPEPKSVIGTSYSTPRRSPTRPLKSHPMQHSENAHPDMSRISRPLPQPPPQETQLRKRGSRMNLLSKLSLRSRKSRASMSDRDDRTIDRSLHPVPHTTGHSPKGSISGDLTPIQKSDVSHPTRIVSAHGHTSTKKQRSQQTIPRTQSRNWFDGIGEEEEEITHIEPARNHVTASAYIPEKTPTIYTERQSLAPSSVVDETTLHSAMIYGDSSHDATNNRYAFEEVIPSFSTAALFSPVQTQLKQNHGQFGATQLVTLPQENRGLQSRQTNRSAFGPGESVLSLSDSDDDKATIPNLTKPQSSKPQSPLKSLGDGKLNKEVKSKHEQKHPAIKSQSPTLIRESQTLPIEAAPRTSSTIRSTSVYLGSSSSESSPDQTPLSSPMNQETDPSERTSWLSSTSTTFPHPPSQVKSKQRKPTNIDITKASKPIKSKLTNSPFSPTTLAATSHQSTPTHHIMAVTADEAMLIASMRRKRASMQQQLFSEGYRTALQEELRIMESLRLEELGLPTPNEKPPTPNRQQPRKAPKKSPQIPTKLDDATVVELLGPGGEEEEPPQPPVPNRGRPVQTKAVTASKDLSYPDLESNDDVTTPMTTESTDFATFDPPHTIVNAASLDPAPSHEETHAAPLPVSPSTTEDAVHSTSFSDFSDDFTGEDDLVEDAPPTAPHRQSHQETAEQESQRTQRQFHYPLNRSNRQSRLPISVHPPSRQSGTSWERSKRSSVARDVLAAWDDLGGKRESGLSLVLG